MAARYGVERGQLLARGREGSVWWKDVVGIRDGDGVLGSWFPNNLQLHVDNGANALLWVERWVGDVPFSFRFRRLYDLCEDKLCTVAQMYARGGRLGERLGSSGGVFGFGRRSCYWSVGICYRLLCNRLTAATCGGGFQTRLLGTQLEGRTGFSLQGRFPVYMLPRLFYGGRKVIVFTWQLF